MRVSEEQVEGEADFGELQVRKSGAWQGGTVKREVISLCRDSTSIDRECKTHNVQDTIDDDLGIGSDGTLTLGQGEDDWVGDPKHDSEKHGTIVDSLDVGGLKLGG